MLCVCRVAAGALAGVAWVGAGILGVPWTCGIAGAVVAAVGTGVGVVVARRRSSSCFVRAVYSAILPWIVSAIPLLLSSVCEWVSVNVRNEVLK